MQAKKDDLTASGIKTRAIKSVKWTVLAEIVSRAAAPLVMLILARLLTPEDFGIVGVAMIVIGLAQILQDFGFEKTLIQRETRVTESANIVFWSNMSFGILVYLILFLGAPIIADFFHDSKVVDVLRVLCLQIILISLTTVHLALLQREFKFKQLFFVRFGVAFVPGIVSIPLALMGHGVWALVWGTLAAGTIQVILFWHLSNWRPDFNFDVPLARQLFGFGVWVTLEALLGWLIVWGDSIVLGHFLGVSELGVYRVGTIFVILAFGIFFDPLRSVAYSSFSRLQSDNAELKRSFLKTTEILSAISLPIGFGLALIAYPISSLIFGNKWEGIEIVIAIIGIMYAVGWVVGINPEVYRAAGRPDANVKLLVANAIYFIPVYVLAAPYGLLVFCIARLGVSVVSLLLHFYVANKILKLPFTYLKSYVKSPLIASFVMGALLYGMVNLFDIFEGWQGWLKLIIVITSGVISYLGALWLIDRDLLTQFFRLLREAIK
jgi:PST family polysaccharide transporter